MQYCFILCHLFTALSHSSLKSNMYVQTFTESHVCSLDSFHAPYWLQCNKLPSFGVLLMYIGPPVTPNPQSKRFKSIVPACTTQIAIFLCPLIRHVITRNMHNLSQCSLIENNNNFELRHPVTQHKLQLFTIFIRDPPALLQTDHLERWHVSAEHCQRCRSDLGILQ